MVIVARSEEVHAGSAGRELAALSRTRILHLMDIRASGLHAIRIIVSGHESTRRASRAFERPAKRRPRSPRSARRACYVDRVKLAHVAAAGAAVALIGAAPAACADSDTTDAPDAPSTATPARRVEPQSTPTATPSVEATATAEPTAAALDPETLAETILRGDPAEPKNIELFRPAIYAAASSLTPAQGPPPTENELRALLAAFTEARFADDPASRDRVMSLFDSGLVAFKIPNPTLRAAFASLTGTIAEPAIDLFVTGTRTEGGPVVFVGIEFGPVSASGIYAQSHAVEGGRHARLVVDEALSSEHFALFTGTLAHEILHHDIFTNDAEEAVAHWDRGDGPRTGYVESAGSRLPRHEAQPANEHAGDGDAQFA